MKPIDSAKLDAIIAAAHRSARARNLGYRERALAMYPWICCRCGREFTRSNLSELTVHHRNHNHQDNPADGSNWELLCLYWKEGSECTLEKGVRVHFLPGTVSGCCSRSAEIGARSSFVALRAFKLGVLRC